MPRVSLKQRLTQDLFILDGATGTQLVAAGAKPTHGNDYLNIEAPDIVESVHAAYFAAGSDAVITNTLCASSIALARHGLADMAEEINIAGARIARKAAGDEKYVLGDIASCGEFLEPLGTVKPDQLKQVFSEQAKALGDGGVDGIIIETMTALDEITIAIEAAKSACPDLPILASMSFDKTANGFRTMMGVAVETFVTAAIELGVDAVGYNCGTSTLDQYVALAEHFVSVVKASGSDILIYAEPNAGKPDLIDGQAVYNVSPEDFAQAAQQIHAAGINIIGGCCGTNPQLIKTAAKNLKK